MRASPASSPLACALALALAAAPVLAQSPPLVLEADDGPAAPGRLRAAAALTAPVLLSPEAEARCGEERITPVFAADLPPGLYGSTFQRGQAGQRINTAAIAFELDGTGRPLGIRALSAGSEGSATDALSPAMHEPTHAAFAGWRFDAGARTGCVLTIRYTPVPIDQADPTLLTRFFGVTRTSGPAREAVQARLRGPGRACDPDRRALTVAFPDFDVGNPRPGVQDWTVVQWSVDAEGRPFDVATLDSSGDAGFDAEARRVAGSVRLEPGRVLTGCLYNWYRRGAILPAPPMPAPPPDPLAACPQAVLSGFRPGEFEPTATAFRARGVEGWALVRFDIAPWGEIGNVAVMVAQPAAAFGEAARRIVMTGRGQPGPGAIRCVQPFQFRVPPER